MILIFIWNHLKYDFTQHWDHVTCNMYGKAQRLCIAVGDSANDKNLFMVFNFHGWTILQPVITCSHRSTQHTEHTVVTNVLTTLQYELHTTISHKSTLNSWCKQSKTKLLTVTTNHDHPTRPAMKLCCRIDDTSPERAVAGLSPWSVDPDVDWL